VSRGTTLFISDLHLDEARPAVTAAFERLLEGEARGADALYILGDLFETWYGDDDDAPLARGVVAALEALSRTVPVAFMRGNRDFIVGARFGAETGATLLADPTCIDLYGTPTLLSHGDQYCTDDAPYQAYRAQVNQPAWQQAVLAQPLSARRALAAQLRAESMRQNAGKPEFLMDVNADAIAMAFRSHGVTRMIHGHTHRPAIHDLTVDGMARQRIVLGDWYEQGSVLRVDARGVELAGLTLS
jgi:UDP-2,3-diacylglucosamine hydrolase